MKRENWQQIIMGILLSKTAVATFSIAPFLVGSYIDNLGATAAQASQVLSIEIFALSISNALAFFWVSRVNYKVYAQRMLLGLLALNCACAFAGGFASLIILRLLVGILEGGLLAIGFGIISQTLKPNRNFGLYFSVSLTIGAINVQLIPLFIESWGGAGLFINLTLYSVIALLGIKLCHFDSEAKLVKSNADKVKSSEVKSPAKYYQVLLAIVLLANFIYFIGQGGLWSFMERLGQQQGIALADISSALAVSLIAGVAGGLTATCLDSRLGTTLPIAFSLICGVAAAVLLFESGSYATYLMAACLFNYGNNLGHSYLLGLIAKTTADPKMTVLSGALQTLGQASGPLIAGLIIVGSDYINAVYLALSMFVITALMLFPALALINAKKTQVVVQDGLST